MNSRQVVVALSNGEMVYFELDEQYAWAERESLNRKEEVTYSPHKPCAHRFWWWGTETARAACTAWRPRRCWRRSR